MKNIDLNRETGLKQILVSLSIKNGFSMYIVGSQLNPNIQSKDLNIIAVMHDDTFIEHFGMNYQSVQNCIKNSEYSDMGLIKYISVVRQIEVELRFKTVLNINFKLVDNYNFDYTLPYLKIDR